MPDSRAYFDQRATPTRKRTDDPPPAKKIKEELPSVLVREKKQKACTNCRRAKLKCIVKPPSAACVRCSARKEACVFQPRGHDEDTQQNLANDLGAVTVQMEHVTRAIHHIMHHLMTQTGMPPLDPPLPQYEAPDREPLPGWSGDRNRESDKRKYSNDEAFGQYGGAGPNSFMRPVDMHVGMHMTQNGPQNGHPNGAIPAPQNGSLDVLGGLVPFDASRPSQDPSISPVDTASFVAPPPSQDSSVPSQAMGTPSIAGGAFGLLSAPRPSMPPEDAVIPVPPVDHDKFGASDPRPNIVKRRVISNDDATILVDL
jgi:hypothetical protein